MLTTLYVAAFVVGGIAVVSALVMTDFNVGTGHDGMPFLSLTGLAAGLVGGATGGLVSTWAGLGGWGSAIIALVSAATLIAALQGAVLPYLRRQQANSHRGRSSYIGLLGTVTLDVPADGWGEVSFVDNDGNRVRSRAKTSEPATLPKSTRVYIADVDADFLHVVAVPDA
jgi:membrane protein implicated in regulation of membrane protease activity